MEGFDNEGLLVSVQEVLNRGRKLKNSKNSGNVGPILSRNFSKAADAFDAGGFLKLAVIGCLF